jgi:FkbM family methyltransferase
MKNFLKKNYPHFFSILKSVKYFLLNFFDKVYCFLCKFFLFRKIDYFFNSELKKKIAQFKYLDKNSVFLDIGANLGKYSQFVDDFCGCKIICYEPHPKAYKYLIEKFRSKKNITIFNKAVANKTGHQNLYLHSYENEDSDAGKFSQSASLYSNKSNVSASNFVRVETVDIKEILDDFNYIDCIKINAEGVEFLILPHLITNHDKIKKVFCSFHHEKISNLDSVYLAIKKSLVEKGLLRGWFNEML